MAYGELDKRDQSIRAFREAIKQDPARADNYFGLALAYQSSLNAKGAEEEFLRAIKIDPEHIDARLFLSMLYADRGDLAMARNQLRKILEIDPSHVTARESLRSIQMR
jgi:Tfp pilus assembly protein PilF